MFVFLLCLWIYCKHVPVPYKKKRKTYHVYTQWIVLETWSHFQHIFFFSFFLFEKKGIYKIKLNEMGLLLLIACCSSFQIGFVKSAFRFICVVIVFSFRHTKKRTTKSGKSVRYVRQMQAFLYKLFSVNLNLFFHP